ncbi:N-acetylglucosamine-1-phosphodiester alpha-N-acetylglucosaminidase isoform X3 [Sceloporus undulatus]|uniref:N-acetylglucosamine-1-phosphodiester alpha-N-acetylglucosaminidase isoform X3 n=1 Tax=Sceloporus undulatus TaxID=8520 RepID=UPI001C4AC37D|nr:N-acetylglucosamine-1-phosphodiester alpha-N-acetylglucosaminidase isoform X3 [Sceloporus undulatus]
MAASSGCAQRGRCRRQKLAAFVASFWALLLLGCFLEAQGATVAWNSMNDDLCLPYPPPQHGPQRRLRYVRDCQTLLLGNATHELWPSDNSSVSPLVVTRGFVSYIPPEDRNGRPVYGHFTIVRDPLRTFSVLEPGGAGRCRSHSTATVEETARNSRCLVAQNGGYFNMDTGQCLGNIVSDGHLVQSSKGVQNAQFGIRKDGTLVFGYLSEEEVLAKENPFVQLVSGVVWLLRNGEVYVNQSRAVECDEIQTTGTFDKFINTVSARTAVGHDKQGQLVLVHVDGQTNTRGLNLWEMADFLKKQGVINAINLDGGGSATLVLNGTLASYPSDHCLMPCGAALDRSQPSCVSMSRLVSLRTAAGMDTARLDNASAVALSGEGQPAMSWTVGLPTAACMECAQRRDAFAMLAGKALIVAKCVQRVPMVMAVSKNASASMEDSVTLSMDLACAQMATEEPSVKKYAPLDFMDQTANIPVSVQTSVLVIRRRAVATFLLQWQGSAC